MPSALSQNTDRFTQSHIKYLTSALFIVHSLLVVAWVNNFISHVYFGNYCLHKYVVLLIRINADISSPLKGEFIPPKCYPPS